MGVVDLFLGGSGDILSVYWRYFIGVFEIFKCVLEIFDGFPLDI